MTTRVLLLEDNSDDALLTTAELRRTGLIIECEVVDNREDFAKAIAAGGWHAVIADSNLPSWSGIEALRLVRDIDPDLPFILVSGTIGEERAVEAMRAGANDYVMKGRLARLGPAVQRELREAAARAERRHLFTELIHNKERYRRTFRHAPVGIVNGTADGVFVSANDRFCEILGYTRDEIVGRRFSDFTHPDDLTHAEERHARFVAEGRASVEFERRFVRKDGSFVWTRITLTPLLHADGTLEEVIGLVEDTTAERASRSRLALQARLLDSVQQAVIATDTQGTIIYWNKFAEQLYGWAADEVMGQPILTLAPFSPALHAQTRECFVRGESFSGEFELHRKDGTSFPAWVIDAPIFDESGTMVGAVGVSHDMTTLKKAEELLRSQKEQLSEAERIAGVGSWEQDFTTGEHRWSDEMCRIFGVEPGGELSLEHVFATIHEDDRDRVRAAHAMVLETREPHEIEFRSRRDDGSERILHVSVRFLSDGGHVRGLGVVQDVTLARRGEAELTRRAFQQSVVANLGHLALSGAALDFLFRQAADSVIDVLGVDFSEIMKKAAGQDRFIVVGGSGWGEDVVGLEKVGTVTSPSALAITINAPVVSDDITSDARFVPTERLARHGATTGVAVPISGSGEVWGALGAYSRAAGAIAASDVDFLRSLASILGQAIERTRAEVELRVRAQQQSAIAELGRIVSTGVDRAALDRTCELVQRGLSVEHALVLERVSETEMLVTAGEIWHEAVTPRQPIAANTQCGQAWVTREPVVVTDYEDDTRFSDTARRAGMRSGIAVPIASSTAFYGVLTAFSAVRRSFTEADTHFMESLANTLAEAMERQQTTLALMESEERYRSVVEGASEIIFEIDRSGRFTALNHAFEKISGTPREQWIGRDFREVLDERDREYAWNLFQRLLEGEPAVESEIRLQLSTGANVVLEVTSVAKVENGELVAVHGFARDVTAARQAERDRQELTRNMRLLLESTLEGIYALDVTGRCTLVNRAAAHLLGRSVEELTGARFHDLIHGRRQDGTAHDAAMCPINDVLVTGEPRAVTEDVFLRSDGTFLPVEYSAAPIVDEGRVVGVVVTFTDVSQRRRLEARLEQANRLSSLGRLAATVAHEFNNVLMGISPFVEVIRRAQNPEKITTSLEHIGKAVKRGRRITEDILRFTQPAEPVLTNVAVESWLGAVVVEARSVLSSQYELELETEPLTLQGDANQLHQIVMNLIFNARDSMPAGGTIHVAAVRERNDARFTFGAPEWPGRYAHIIVRDEGCGMSEETRRHAFEPLYTTKKSGTGLGLAVTHQVVLRHKGEIFVESEVGRGTTFHLFLPLAGVIEPATVPEPAISPAQDVPSRRVLLVEDDPGVAEGITTLLELDGYTVASAMTGASALVVLSSWLPDVVMLDVGLPDMDGRAVFAAIRAMHGDLPVVFSTGHADRAHLEDLLSQPNVTYLLKPYESAALVEALERVMLASPEARRTGR